MKLKRCAVALALTLLVVSTALLTWAYIPVSLDTGAADTSVVYANRDRSNTPLFREAYFEHNKLRLHYVEAGNQADEVILFIHGYPSYWFSFIRQMQAFKSDYRVVAIDGLGAGHSEVPSNLTAYKLEAMTAHVLALIDKLGAEKVHLVGHDWGAAFAMGFAQRYPKRVHTVTGMSAPPQSIILELLANYPTERKVFAYVESLKKANAVFLMALDVQNRIWKSAYSPLLTKGKISEEESELFRKAAGNPKRINAHTNWYRANIPSPEDIQESDYWPSRKARITMPAQFIWGEDDRIITPNVIKEIHSISDNLTTLPLPDVGHWPHIDRADTVTASIRALISLRNDNGQ